MSKLPEIWKLAAGASSPAEGPKPDAALLLPEADLDLHDEDIDADDPDIPEFIREAKKVRQHERQVVAFDEKQRLTAQTNQESDAAEQARRMREWVASEQYRQAIRELSADIDDARKATSWAYQRALDRQREADEALEDARRHAIVLGDGRRVYFSRDGRLCGEDDRQIMDSAAIAEARHGQQAQPDATSHEDFIERRNAWDRATEKAQQLKNALGALYDLDGRLKKGNLSPDELARLRKEKQDIVDSLPPEARKDYEQRKAARDRPEAEYKSASDLHTDQPAFPTAPDATKHFANAAQGQPAPAQAQVPQPGHRPGHTPTPQDTDDYRPGF